MKNIGKPVTQRQLRVGEMIKQAIGILFIRDEAKLPSFSTKEITVTEVRMSPDLKTAKIFVMPLGGKDADDVVLKLKEFKKDKHSSVGMLKAVNKRKKLLDYLKKNKINSYKEVISKLNLRK